MKELLLHVWKALHLPSGVQLFLMRTLNDQFLVGLTGVIFNDKNEVLLFRHTYRTVEWSLPGGYLLAKEHPAEGLEREIEEESGFVVSIDFPLKVRTDRHTGRLDLSYVGYYCGGEFKQSEEVYEYGFFTLETLPVLIKSQVLMIKEAIDLKQKLKEKFNLSQENIPQTNKKKQQFVRFLNALN